jgi:hypothetical protein
MIWNYHIQIYQSLKCTQKIINKNKNGITKTFLAPYYRCVWVNLGVNYVDALYIKIFVNNTLFKELNLMNPNDRFYIDSTRIIEE